MLNNLAVFGFSDTQIVVTEQYYTVTNGWFEGHICKGGCKAACMQTGTEGSCLVGPCSHLLACGPTFSWHRKTDQGLPVANANFTLNWNKPILKKQTNKTTTPLALRRALKTLEKKLRNPIVPLFFPV